ncbi:manganese efflux pump MntP family protein [Gottschalkiaceae bacterium SANA]|nr:manganese efflux pump MntP family protein [Gottschalkiaceae bacterium SANA]
MAIGTMFVIALALAMDAFTVSISCGVSNLTRWTKEQMKLAIFFGGFQGLMPILGYAVIRYFQVDLSETGGFVAMTLLGFIGAKMIWESFKPIPNRCDRDVCMEEMCDREFCLKTGKPRELPLKELLTLSVATSIDALAVGVSFALIGNRIVLPALIIAVVTAILSFFGARFGLRLGERFGKLAERVGGMVLIALGILIMVG